MAAEAADLFYFAMTRCVAAGVSLDMVESHLDRRALKLNRRPGNDKKERIEAAAAILAKKTGTAPPAECKPCKDKPAPPLKQPALLALAVAGAAAAMLLLRSAASKR